MVHEHGGTGRHPAGSSFLKHYLEMVLAMAVGMPVYGLLFVSPMDPLGYREVLRPQPYLREMIMLVAMSLPMAGFMAYRGHSLRQTVEMLAGMGLPALLVIGLTATASVPFLTVATLTVFSHVGMLLGMLLAMLYRPRNTHTTITTTSGSTTWRADASRLD